MAMFAYADKDPQSFMAGLRRRASTIVITDLRDRAGAGPRPSSRRLRLRSGLRARSSRNKTTLKRGLELATEANARLLVPGSLYLVGALGARSARRPPATGRNPAPRGLNKVKLIAPNSPLMTKARSALSTVFGHAGAIPDGGRLTAITGEDVLAVATGGQRLIALPAACDRLATSPT